MRGCVRLLCIVGLLLLAGGIIVASMFVGFACFDVCPPSLSGYAAFYLVGGLLPGLLVAGLGWVLTLLLLFQEGHPWRGGVALAAFPVCVIGSALAILANNAGHLLPVGAGAGMIRWEHSLGGVLILLPCWPLVTLLSTIGLPHEEAPNAPAAPA